MERIRVCTHAGVSRGRFHAKAMCSFEFSVSLYRKDEVLVKE